MIFRNERIEKIWNETDRKFVVFGTSNLAAALMEDVQKFGQVQQISYFTDNDSSLWGQTMRFGDKEYQIKPPENLKNEKEASIVIASTYVYDIAVQLNQYDALKYTECFFYPFMKWKPDYTLFEYLERTRALRGKYKDQEERFAEIKNSHIGERCFIIGNGPSLTPEDLNLLKDEFCFGANQIFFSYKKTQWRPNVYLTVNIDTMMAYQEIIDRLDCPLKIIDRKCLDYGVEIKNALYLNHGTFAAGEDLFSDDISKYYYNGNTVVYTAMQVASYMGFKQIYLIGVDNHYAVEKRKNGVQIKNNVQNHFYKEDEEKKTANLYATADVDHLTQFYCLAREYAMNHGIAIYNATRGGKLEVFPRVRLEDVLKEAAL